MTDNEGTHCIYVSDDDNDSTEEITRKNLRKSGHNANDDNVLASASVKGSRSSTVSSSDESFVVPYYEKSYLNETTAEPIQKRRRTTIIDRPIELSKTSRSKIPQRLQCKVCRKNYDRLRIVNHYVKNHPNSEVHCSSLPSNIVDKLPRHMSNTVCDNNKYRMKCIFCQCHHEDTYHGWYLHFTVFTGEYLFKCRHGKQRLAKQMKCSCKIVQIKKVPEKQISAYICKSCNYVQLSKRNVMKHLKENCDDSMGYRKVILLSADANGECDEDDSNYQYESISSSDYSVSSVPIETPIKREMIEIPKIADPERVEVVVQSINIKPWIPNDASTKPDLQLDHLLALFKCLQPSCSFSTDDAMDMVEHVTIHSLENKKCKINCSYCCSEFQSGKDLVKHILHDHSASVFQCASCFYRSPELTNVISHNEQFHGENVQRKVLYCGGQRSLTQIAFFNLWKHLNEMKCELLKCGECEEDKFGGCFSYADLRSHLSIDHPNQLYTCGICYASVQLKRIECHLHYHGLPEFQCIYCEFGCSDIDAVKQHMAATHWEKFLFVAARRLNLTKLLYIDNHCDKLLEKYEIQPNCDNVASDKLKLIEAPKLDNSTTDDFFITYSNYFKTDSMLDSMVHDSVDGNVVVKREIDDLEVLSHSNNSGVQVKIEPQSDDENADQIINTELEENMRIVDIQSMSEITLKTPSISSNNAEYDNDNQDNTPLEIKERFDVEGDDATLSYNCTKCDEFVDKKVTEVDGLSHFMKKHKNDRIELNQIATNELVHYTIICNVCEKDLLTKSDFILHFMSRHNRVIDATIVRETKSSNASESIIYYGQVYKCLDRRCREEFQQFYSFDEIEEHTRTDLNHFNQKFECYLTEPIVFSVNKKEIRDRLLSENLRFDQHFLYVCSFNECENKFYSTKEKMYRFHCLHSNAHYKFNFSVRKLIKCGYCAYISTIDMMKKHFEISHSNINHMNITDVNDHNCYVDGSYLVDNGLKGRYAMNSLNVDAIDSITDDVLLRFTEGSSIFYSVVSCCQFYYENDIEVIEHIYDCQKSPKTIKNATQTMEVAFENGFTIKLKYLKETVIGRNIIAAFENKIIRYPNTELFNQNKRKRYICITGQHNDTMNKLLELHDPFPIIHRIANESGVQLETGDLKQLEVLKNKKHSIIIVEFMNRSKKIELQQAYNTREKKCLTISKLFGDIKSTAELFLNEYLTRYFYFIWKGAVKARFEKKLHAVWFLDGCIMVQKVAGSPPIRIFDDKTLRNVLEHKSKYGEL